MFYGGENVGLVKVHYNVPLKDAIPMCQGLSEKAEIAKYKCHVFRSSVKVIEGEIAETRCKQLLAKCLDKFIRQSLRATSTDCVFFRETQKDCAGFQKEKLLFDLKNHKSYVTLPTDGVVTIKNLENMSDNIVTAISKGHIRPLYALNMAVDGMTDEIQLHLKHAPLHINSEINEEILPSHGINKPSCYFAGRCSFTEMHIEDGFLDSCNVIHWALGEGFAKLWIIVDPRDSVKLEAEVGKVIEEQRKKIQLIEKSGEMNVHSPSTIKI